ncbi:MAG: TldD/PmbA family protein [Euryarchaeota archaeon]|nr:TldD/PmbA family protein [Thermoplasmata archaeon]MVT13545.1 TldD/PmbA family protein [Euryarchaeota archaeon]MVT14131.1 TldD/PmbA family protein [Euryarchaeota archaeon]MVT35832.1 TldD/PmbA family protein [Euryarchaeota archaeon]
MNMDIERFLMDIEKHARYGEIRIMRLKRNMLIIKNGVISGIESTDETGFAVRVLDRNFSFFSTSNLDESNLKKTVDRAIKTAKSLDKREIKLSEEDIIKDSWDVSETQKIDDFPLEEKVSHLIDIDKNLDSIGVPIRMQFLRDKITEIEYMNTEGTRINGRLPSIFYYYFIGVIENGNFEQGSQEFGRSGGYEALKEWNLIDTTIEEAKKLKKIALGKKINEGKMDLIVGPEVSGIVAHESCGHPMESDRIMGREAAQAGESFVKQNMIGERIGSDKVNVVDDPTIEHSFGYYKYDFEGVKARKRYLYKNGKINEFLMNREFAGMLGQKSNAAARSSEWDKEPIVRMSTTYIEPGDYNLDEMLEDIKYGIFMNSFTEWNIDDIRFNEKYVGREAYLIENGEIKDPVKRPVLEITTTGFYSAVDAVSRDLKFFAGTCGKGDPMQGVDVWMGGPFVRLRGIYMR